MASDIKIGSVTERSLVEIDKNNFFFLTLFSFLCDTLLHFKSKLTAATITENLIIAFVRKTKELVLYPLDHLSAYCQLEVFQNPSTSEQDTFVHNYLWAFGLDQDQHILEKPLVLLVVRVSRYNALVLISLLFAVKSQTKTKQKTKTSLVVCGSTTWFLFLQV